MACTVTVDQTVFFLGGWVGEEIDRQTKRVIIPNSQGFRESIVIIEGNGYETRRISFL